jgi:hypothetical protein
MTTRTGRRGWVLVLGVVVLVGLLGTAVALWIAGSGREADNVAGFARAPIGCDTTLDFESTGTFVIYLETTGRFGELAGACEVPERYDRSADDVPDVEISLRNPVGAPVELAEALEVDYDVDGFIGSSIAVVDIDVEGDHVLTVEPIDGPAVAVAVGRQPDQGVALLRWGAAGAAIGGLVLGGLLLVVGSRRPPAAPAAPPAPWTPDASGWPASPPGFPVPPPTTGASGPPGPSAPAPSPAPWGPPTAPPAQ